MSRFAHFWPAVLFAMALAAPPAVAQLQEGDILVNIGDAAGTGDLIQAYRPTGALVYQTSGGTGSSWGGCSILLPDDQIATRRSNPAYGINLFGPNGTESATFNTPQVTKIPGDVDRFNDGTIVVIDNDPQFPARMYDPQGNHVQTISLSSPILAKPTFCYVDTDDNLWIVDRNLGIGGVARFDREGNLLGNFFTNFEPGDLVVAPDGTLWITDAWSRTAVHMLEDGTVLSSFQVATLPTSYMAAIALLPDDTLVFTAQYETRLLRYDTQGNLLNTINLVLPAGTGPALLDVVQVKRTEFEVVPPPPVVAPLQDGDILVNLNGSPTGINQLRAYRPDGTLVYQSSGGSGTNWRGCSMLPDGRIVTSYNIATRAIGLFDLTQTEYSTFETNPFWLNTDVDCFSDGTIVACNQKTADAYDAKGNLLQVFASPGILLANGCHVDFNDELWIADLGTGQGLDGGVHHFDRQGNLVGSFQTGFSVGDLVVAPDGTLWITDFNGGLAVHTLEDGTVLSSFPAVGAFKSMSGIALLPDGTLVCSARNDIRLWRYDAQGTLLGTIHLLPLSQPLFLDVVSGHAWSNLGNALPGVAGAPELSGEGKLLPGSRIRLTLESAAPAASSALIIGSTHANLPFLGGTLVPSPDIVLLGLPTDASGGWKLASTWPAGTWPVGVPSGTRLHFQTWVTDSQAPQGYSASNGLSATVP